MTGPSMREGEARRWPEYISRVYMQVVPEGGHHSSTSCSLFSSARIVNAKPIASLLL